MIVKSVRWILVLIAAGDMLHAQTGAVASGAPAPISGTPGPATTTLPSFDVVSIKPHKDEGMMMRMGISAIPDGFQADGVSLQMLIRQAFGLSEDRILNEPDWAKSARFDINAKVAPEDAPKLKALTMDQRSAMLLPVLEDRFGLKYHHETKQLQVYALVVAKGGSKLKEAKPDQDGASPAPEMSRDAARGSPIALNPGAGGAPGTPRTIMRMSTQGMTLDAHGTSMARLAQMLSQQMGATVVDKTGLTANYDFTLSFMPDMATGAGPMMRPPGGGAPPDGAQTQEPVGPSIFAALPEQLGLKLESQKQLADVIVIDHIAQPSAN